MKASKKKVAKKSAKKTAKKAGAKRRAYPKNRNSYPEALQKKVVKAIRKGMTYKEAVKAFSVGINSIPGWLRKHV